MERRASEGAAASALEPPAAAELGTPQSQSERSGEGGGIQQVASTKHVSEHRVRFEERATAINEGSGSIRKLDSLDPGLEIEDMALEQVDEQVVTKNATGEQSLIFAGDLAILNEQIHALSRERATRHSKDAKEKSGRIRSLCHRVSELIAFKAVFTALLTVNVLLLAAEANALVDVVQLPEAARQSRLLDFVGVSEHVFTFLFSLEILIRVLGSRERPWRDGWLVVDGVIVGMSILDTWVLAGLASSSNIFKSFGSLRVVRLARAFRVIRVIRILHYVRPLRLVAEAMGEAFLATAWVVVITFAFAWCYAIIDSTNDSPGVAMQLLNTNLTLLRGVHWGELVRSRFGSDDVMHVSSAYLYLLFVVALLISFLNIIQGAFIGALRAAANKDSVLASGSTLFTGEVSLVELKKVFGMFDTGNRDFITNMQFVKGIEANATTCANLGLHSKNAKAMFRLMDINRSGLVSAEEFLIGCLKKGWTSKSMDMLCMDYMQAKLCQKTHSLRSDHYWYTHAITNHTEKVDGHLLDVSRATVRLQERLEASSVRESALWNGGGWKDLGMLSPEEQVLNELEESCCLYSRMEELTKSVEHWTKSRRIIDASKPDGRGQNLVGREREKCRMNAVGNTAQAESIIADVLYNEALPWLRRRLATSRPVRFAPSPPSPPAPPLAPGLSAALAPRSGLWRGLESEWQIPKDSAKAEDTVEPQPDPLEGSGLRPSLLEEVKSGSPWFNPNNTMRI